MRQLTSLELLSGVKLQLTVVNPRLIMITPNSKEYELLDENGKLVGLDYNGEYLVKKGSVLKVGNQKYKISEIQRSTSNQGYELYTFRKITTTANFIVPFIGDNRTDVRWDLEFTNAFIGTHNSTDTTKVSLLYRFNGSINFTKFENELKELPGFIEAVDTDKYHTLYTFELPKEYAEDIELILKGKYSCISENAKQRIIDFHFSDKKKPIGQILYKCSKRRKQMEEELRIEIPEDAELFERFHIPNEIFQEHFIIKERDAGTTKASDFI